MRLRLLSLFLYLFFAGAPLFAQTTDSLPHADTAAQVKKVIDSVLKDTVSITTPTRGYVLRGKIQDMNTSEGIPFAVIYFLHSGIGATADVDGNFSLSIDELPGDTVQAQALGYTPIKKVLRKGERVYNYMIELARAENTLSEFTFHSSGEDPALVLMRHIIEHKPDNNPDKAENYSYEAYNRLEADLQRLSYEQFSRMPLLKSYSFIFQNLDTVSEATPYLPIYLTETLSDFYYRGHPKKQREFIKASAIEGVNNDNIVKYLGTLYQNVNVYKNYIPVFDKKFISPISNEGTLFYKYKIKDTQTAYGHRIILVQFQPRRAGESCFTGDFWVVDSSFAIQRISMDVSKLANLNWVDRVSLYQEFAPEDSMWFCVKDKFIANFTVYNSKRLPGFIGRKTTTYHHIKINESATDSVLDDPRWKEDVIKNDSAKQKSKDWWMANRPDSLTKNEKAIQKMIDTITKMPITTVYKNAITFIASGVKDVGPIELGPYYYIYSSNSVEGNRFRLSVATPRTLKDLHVTAYAAYGDKDKKFKYGGTALWIAQREPRMYLYGYYSHDVTQANTYYDQASNDNIFSTLFRKPGIPYKLAFADVERLEFYKQYYNRFSHKLILQHKEFTPYNLLPSEGIFYDLNNNPSKSVTSSEVGIDFRFAYKEKYFDGQWLRVNLGSKYPVIHLEVTQGLKGVLNSSYQYQKARFSITESINIPPFGHIYYNMFAGKYFGTLPYPLLEIHPGNEYYYYNKYAFQMMNTYEFVSDQYAGFNIEHNIGGGIFNRIPLLKQLKFRQFWTAKGVWGSLSKANETLNFNKDYPFRSLQGDPYLELGTGVSNIFQVFRIDFVWRVTPKPLADEAKSRYFGIFGSANFEF